MTPPQPEPATCAGPGCHNPVVRRHHRGRPPRYCSPTCRQQAAQPHVEIDHDPVDGRPVGRVWTVRLHRNGRSVVIADHLGRPSADYLAHQIASVLGSPQPARGGATRHHPRARPTTE
jgi:hypothetical protein